MSTVKPVLETLSRTKLCTITTPNMSMQPTSARAEPKSAVVKDSADLVGTKALSAHNAPKADVSRVKTSKPSNGGVAKKSIKSAPAARGSKVKGKGSLGYMRMPVACGECSF